ncbi:disulfide bond formation protein B [Pseudosulfitobacter pseudonitzschiae]|uniref:disulfide bond formation protein B n=1 Tax=Pseudosulfitobacter pseudonitzschiae TaxID=1402135 RepID=UPI003B7E46BB
MTRDHLPLVAGLISTTLLAGAFFFQYVLGLVPCGLCLTQRWLHAGALLATFLALALPSAVSRAIGLLAASGAAAGGFFHAGVELQFWDGPQACSDTGEDLATMSGQDLLSFDAPAHIVKCTEIAWEFAGISMAGWNGLISLCAVLIWIIVLFRPGKSYS